MPVKGETILGNNFAIISGGKGANQAIALARLGAEVAFMGKIGADSFGDRAVKALKDAGVKTKYVLRDKLHHSGLASILVDQKGDNIIAVFPGSNGFLGRKDILEAREMITKSKVLILQLEIPLGAVTAAVNLARKKKIKIILNAAPAQELPDALLSKIDILVLNAGEVEVLAGMEVKDSNTIYKAAGKLLDKGVGVVVVTLGGQGAALIRKQGNELIPLSVRVKAVDTTAAGDAFTAALAIATVEGKDLTQSIAFANRVAALTVTKMGAVDSLPTREEVENFYN